eukprot:707451_1
MSAYKTNKSNTVEIHNGGDKSPISTSPKSGNEHHVIETNIDEPWATDADPKETPMKKRWYSYFKSFVNLSEKPNASETYYIKDKDQ